jgi:hypothetical protein
MKIEGVLGNKAINLFFLQVVFPKEFHFIVSSTCFFVVISFTLKYFINPATLLMFVLKWMD